MMGGIVKRLKKYGTTFLYINGVGERMDKKGQTILFVVLGILILFTVLLYALLSYVPKAVPAPKMSESLHACSEAVLKDVVADIAFQGGYAVLPDSVFPTIFGEVAYYHYDNKTVIPSEEMIVKAIEAAAQDQLQSCQQGAIGATVTATDADIRATVLYPNEGTPPIVMRIPARLLTLNKAAKRVLQAMDEPLTVPSSSILQIEEDHRLEITATWDDESVLYFISEKDPAQLPLTWAFGVRP